jgi:hypothetical protein
MVVAGCANKPPVENKRQKMASLNLINGKGRFMAGSYEHSLRPLFSWIFLELNQN